RGSPRATAEPICRRIQEKTGLRRDQVLLTSSHTHTGPLLALRPVPRSGLSVADAERTAEYTRQLQDKVVDVVARAAARPTPARLSWGGGSVPFVTNRRPFTPAGVV